MGIEQSISKFSPKQDKLLAAWGSKEYSIYGVMGGNRSGKSFAAAAVFGKYIRDEAETGEYWCVAPNKELSTKGQQKLLWDLIPRRMFGRFHYDPKVGFGTNSPQFILDERTPDNLSGRHIHVYFKTMSQYEDDMQSFESVNVMDAWVDEAISEECFAALETRIILNDGRIIMSTVPSLMAEWTYERITHNKDDSNIFLVEIMPEDNPIMTPEMMERFEKSIPKHMREMRLRGKHLMAGALVYVEFDPSSHIIKHGDVPGDTTWYGCLDEGMDHPTAFLLVGVSRDGKAYVYDEYYSRNQTPEADVVGINNVIGDRKLEWPIVADPALWQSRKTGMSAMRYGDAGLDLIPAMRTSKFGEDHGVYGVKEMLRHNELFVCESCENLIREFYLWKYKRDKDNRPMASDQYEDKNNDGLDALRYLISKGPKFEDPKYRNVYVFASDG
tara:strand:+ start:2248 stop:3576 length:1329 start_codon:yes stop_codon:yes gene_type:complete